MHNKTILLIVGGGIAAYKALELVRELRRAGATVIPVLTDGGARFVTALSLGALAEQRVRSSLWDLEAEASMGHIALSRAADLIIVCPATADLMARAAAGIADDLATTLLLATDTPVLMVPAMNVRMWQHPATQRNIAILGGDGVTVMPPDVGAMACGEYGPGRLPAVPAIMSAIGTAIGTAIGAAIAAPSGTRPLAGRTALVTAGPTHEAIDPVRYLGNRSSGKQGFAIAAALALAGADVTLIAGPVALATPAGCTRIDVVSGRDMAAAVEARLAAARPIDVAVMVAAVADWRVEAAPAKLKKTADGPPALRLLENPDILAAVGHAANRPRLVIGFAAETSDLIANAKVKLAKKAADWIIANDVSTGIFGADATRVHLVSAAGDEDWGASDKDFVANRLVARIADALG